MKIFIMTPTGEKFKLEVEPETLVADVQQQIEDQKDIAVDCQRLLYGGKQLNGNRTLSDYNIRDTAALHLLLREGSRDIERILCENVPSYQDDVDKKLRYWRLSKNASFDHDMDIVDPDAYHRHLELLSDAVAERSEFIQCLGRYSHFGQHLTPTEPVADVTDDIQSIPEWMWSAFRNVGSGCSPEQLEQLLSTDSVLASLWKTCLILTKTLSSFKRLEKAAFCKASYSLLISHPGTDIAELVRIPIVEVEAIQTGVINCLEYMFRQKMLEPDDTLGSLFEQVLAPCKSILVRLNHQIDALSIGSILVVARVTALLLDLALVSYTGSHGLRFDEDYLKRDARTIEVHWAGSPLNFTCRLTSLACLKEFLDNREVWVFDLRGPSQATTTSSARPSAILTRMDDFADIWGPIYAVPGPTNSSKIRQYNVSKGIICRTGGSSRREFRDAIKCHWYSRMSWIRGLAMKILPPSDDWYLSPDDLLLIGDAMVENLDCDYSLDHYEADYGDVMGELGTKQSSWRWDTRGVSIGFSKMIGISASGTQKRIPDTPLKQKILDKWLNAPDRRNPSMLNQFLGVEVSNCTGNASRVAVRTLLTLKPMARLLARQFPDWQDADWGCKFKKAIESDRDAAIERVWMTCQEQRPQMAQLVCYALDLLSSTGFNGSELGVAFFNNGQELSLNLDLKRNTWALLLKDTHLMAAFCLVNERCLGCRVPDHSAAACCGSGATKGLTMLRTEICLPSGATWDRVSVKSASGCFKKVDMGSDKTILAPESRRDAFTAVFQNRAVEGIESRNRSFRWGNMIPVYVQASETSYGGMQAARSPRAAARAPGMEGVEDEEPRRLSAVLNPASTHRDRRRGERQAGPPLVPQLPQLLQSSERRLPKTHPADASQRTTRPSV